MRKVNVPDELKNKIKTAIRTAHVLVWTIKLKEH